MVVCNPLYCTLRTDLLNKVKELEGGIPLITVWRTKNGSICLHITISSSKGPKGKTWNFKECFNRTNFLFSENLNPE